MITVVKNKFEFDEADFIPEFFELIDRKTINVQFEMMSLAGDANQLLITEQKISLRKIGVLKVIIKNCQRCLTEKAYVIHVGKTPKVITRNCSNKKNEILSASSFSQEVLQQVGWVDDIECYWLNYPSLKQRNPATRLVPRTGNVGHYNHKRSTGKTKVGESSRRSKSNKLDLPDQHLSVDEKQQQFEVKKRTIEEKIRRLKTLCRYTRINQRKVVGVYPETKEGAEKKGRQIPRYG
ncbi:hypothetical protein LOAG_17627 [Loa loa]|uniref:Uncharacterized protein n=1 Tax=Loa loa TaxID=7209 RepID=A0A1S0UIB4_LOALO|nr:hypothetical protein LOAG_17627 [Loa loa]EJD75166.1 hypothetical protein LOAG_17627 [Loa loa]